LNSAALAASALALAALLPATASADEGRFQIKAFVSHVAVDGAIDSVKRDAIPLPAGSDTRASDSWVPTIAAEYFVTPRLSIETICCVTQHDVTGSGKIKGATLIDKAEVIPATVTLKYHFPLDNGIKPYVGAGPAYFMIFGEDLGAGARSLGATRASLSSELGAAIQAGVDIPLPGRNLGLSLDAKRYFVDTTARYHARDSLVLQSEHQLDPWVLSAGLSWRF